MRSGSDTMLDQTIANIASEIEDNEAQLSGLQRVFSNDTALTFSKKYESEDVRPLHGGNARGGCMNAVYEGLEVLYGLGNDFRREVYNASRAIEKKHGLQEGAANSVDLIMQTLQKKGLAGEGMQFHQKKGQMGAFGGEGNPGQGSTKRSRLVFLRHVCLRRVPFGDVGRR